MPCRHLGSPNLRPYLERCHFELFADQKSLKWTMELTDVNNRLDRWSLFLMEYDFKVFYRKGAKNMIADAMTRL